MGRVSKSVVALRIWSDDLDPDEITRLIGKAPDIVQRRGQPMVTPSGRTERIMERSSWSLKSAPRTPCDLDLQVAEILDGTTPDIAVWKGLASRHKMDLFVGLFLGTFNEGATLSSQTLHDLGARGIELDLDIYGNGPVDIEVE